MTPQELKGSILSLAVQGKLVEQRSEEGTAEELYQQIQVEKQKLIKAGTIKKEKPLPEITEDEKPFDIPENWKWVRIGQIFSLQAGKNITASDIYEEQSPEHSFLCYGGNGIRGYVSSNNRSGHYALIGRQGALCGNINFASGDFYATEHAVVADHFQMCDVLWSGYFLRALNLNQYATATAQPGLAVNNIVKVLIPLPPLTEQKRIVAKIEELLPYIDRYEKAWSKLEDFNKRFPIDMQKSVLQMAIEGKLVEQRPEEGTGEKLYQQIQAEKQRLIKAGIIKKDKPLPEMTEDEKPFDIPESWKWVRIGSLMNKLVDGTHRTPRYTASGIPFVSVKNMSSGKLDLSNTRFITKEEHKELWTRCNPERNDILLSKVGTTGVPAIVETDVEFSLFVSVALLKFNTSLINNQFLVYAILSPDFQRQCKLHTRGVGNKNWVIQDIANTVFPLPPLAEQQRIVAKLEEILPLCEKLK